MAIFLSESGLRQHFFPLTHTRHVADLRIGIYTIREKWEAITGEAIGNANDSRQPGAVLVPANVIPTKDNAAAILHVAKQRTPITEADSVKLIHYPWDIFLLNDWALRRDFELITAGKTSQPLPPGNFCHAPENIFLEEGAKVSNTFLNASTGPIYIGRNAEIMDGVMIRGPFAAGEGAVVKMGAKIYGATTIGPYCVAGGEIKNAVLFGYSNKAHDGYLGDSVLGEWCNIGAGTSNSNLKNTGGVVRYSTNNEGDSIAAGNKAGLIMGDYSRAAINTSFNTGTVVGVCCNIFGEAPGKFVNNFSWGGERYIFEKALADISNWKKMKGQLLSANEIEILKELYHQNP